MAWVGPLVGTGPGWGWGELLDEQDRRALAEIEQRLSGQDPQFPTRRQDTAGRDNPVPTVLALCASLYVLLPMVSLLFGWGAVVITFDLFAVALAIVLARRRIARSGR